MKKRSLVLVTVDCLRADHTGFLGYARPVTPHLDALAADSVVVPNAIVAGAPTYYSLPAILASRYPLALGRDVLGIAPHEPTLATALRDAGYATAAFLAGNPYLSRRYGYDQSFDVFQDFLGSAISGESVGSAPLKKGTLSKLNQRIQAGLSRNRVAASAYEEMYFWYCQWRAPRAGVSMDVLRRYPAANVIVDQAQSWLSSVGQQPFFLWLHLMDPHHPYYPPEESLEALGQSRITAPRARFLNSFWNRGDVSPQRLTRHRDEIVSLYDAGVYWVDKQLSRLVAGLRRSERWDETVLVVTADHGEAFLEHGDRYHSPTSLPEHLIRVPLLVRAPELSGRRTSPGPFSLIHLAPTVLDAIGIVPPKSFQGRSAWKQVSAGGSLAESTITECVEGCTNPARRNSRMHSRLLAVRDEELKLVVNFREGQDYLYDLKSDPGERSPLGPSVRIRDRARLLQVARRHLVGQQDGRNESLRLGALIHEIRQALGMTGGEAEFSPVG